MSSDYTQVEGYHHYKSHEFAAILHFSTCLFESYLSDKTLPRVRPADPPNTPRSTVDSDSQPEACSSDEDDHPAMPEAWWQWTKLSTASCKSQRQPLID